MQSPVCVDEIWAKKRNYTKFLFIGYHQLLKSVITYTDHAINIKFLPEVVLPSVCGGGLFKDYALTALEFHWESEHAINGKRYPLEGQLIHYAKIYENLENALNYKDGVAILSTFYNVSKNPNDAFENLIETIPVIDMKLEHPVELLQPVIPRYFLTPKVGKFYRYNGSLTTPCFDEAVVWTLFSAPSHISESQLERLTHNWNLLKKPLTENCRTLQDVEDRRVYLSAI